jgi:hypothetical protein
MPAVVPAWPCWLPEWMAAALACSPGIASADSSNDWWATIDNLLGGGGLPAVATTLDYQVSIDGIDLLPTDGNTATANSGAGDFAIAIGDGSTPTQVPVMRSARPWRQASSTRLSPSEPIASPRPARRLQQRLRRRHQQRGRRWRLPGHREQW